MSRNISRVLVDDRVVSMQIDAHDASLLADSMEDAGLQARGLRIACIHAPEYSTVYRLFETGHQSRSLNFRVFSDKAAALEWVLAD